jgi:hypothetical protein
MSADTLSPPHPLDAVPLRVPGIESKPDADGSLHLRFRIPPRGTADGWLRNVLRLEPNLKLKLDPKGSEFWGLIDGKGSLREIAASLAQRWECSEQAAGDSVILFTKTLMTRNLVALEIPAHDKKERQP